MTNPSDKARKRGRPVAHDSGVSLLGPTPGYDRWRIVYVDPFTGQRPNRSFPDEERARIVFAETVAYVSAAAHAVAKNPVRRSGPLVVVDVMVELEKRWALTGAALRYRQNRRSIFDKWIAPVCGTVGVRDWAGTDEYCLEVLVGARAAGLAPASVQNIGALLVGLRNMARRKRWIAALSDPMDGVAYTAAASVRGGAVYVAPKARPTTSMCECLAGELEKLGIDVGLPWLGLMTRVACYCGPRFGELTAFMPEDWGGVELQVRQAWGFATGTAPWLKGPKNNKGRHVLPPASLRGALDARTAEVAEFGPGALLFPGKAGPCSPLTEGEFRRLFQRAARNAGWEMRGDAADRNGTPCGGTPVLPYRNLRHHAATWMHDVANFDWADVSYALGHHSVAFTQARYVRQSADADARNLRRLDEL